MSQRPPKQERLEKRLARVARELNLNQERLRHWVSFLALCGVLERACAQGILRDYYLKGGVAMELRFALQARATKDLDIGLAGSRTNRLKSLEEALALGFDEFTFRLKAGARQMGLADAVRVEISILYQTRAWQTIDADLGAASTVAIDLVEPRVSGLEELGIPVISPVRCLGLADQLAQKLHACTGPASKGRARDVLDILLVDTMQLVSVQVLAEAARKVFQERATHSLPVEFVMPGEWYPELESLARTLELPFQNAQQIAARFRALIEEVANASAEITGQRRP